MPSPGPNAAVAEDSGRRIEAALYDLAGLVPVPGRLGACALHNQVERCLRVRRDHDKDC